MENDPRYSSVNELHALGYPAVNRREAGKAAKLLIRVFGKPEDASAVRELHMRKSGLLREWTDGDSTGSRRCWASQSPTKEFHKGWGRLIHDMAHMVYRYRHPGQRPHGDGEGAIEFQIAYFVRYNTDWLKGSLRAKKIVKANPLPALEDRLELWQSKLKRAENAIKKLNRKIAYHRRKNENREVET
jgi:hypothetical protein